MMIKFKIFIDPEVYAARISARQMPLNAGLLRSCPSVLSDFEHFLEMTTALKALTRSEISDYRLGSVKQDVIYRLM